MRKMAYFVVPLIYAFSVPSFAADPSQVRAIAQYVREKGYSSTVRTEGTLRLSTILVPARLAGLPERNEFLNVSVNQGSDNGPGPRPR